MCSPIICLSAARRASWSCGISCSSSSSDLMTARKSGTFGCDLPAMPPSRRPPASGAALTASAPRPTLDHVSLVHAPSTAASLSGVHGWRKRRRIALVRRGRGRPPRPRSVRKPVLNPGCCDIGVLTAVLDGGHLGISTQKREDRSA